MASPPVNGDSADSHTPGVKGTNTSGGGTGVGVWGESQQGNGVYGWSHSAGATGVVGQNFSANKIVWLPNTLQAIPFGVQGLGGQGVGVLGSSAGPSPGVVGHNNNGSGPGVAGINGNSKGATSPVGVWREHGLKRRIRKRPRPGPCRFGVQRRSTSATRRSHPCCGRVGR